MQSGSAEKAPPPSLQPHNKACNYCSFPFIHLSISPTLPSLHLGPSLTHLPPSFPSLAAFLPRRVPATLAPPLNSICLFPSSIQPLALPSPPTILPQLCPSLPPSEPVLPLTSSVMSHLCGGGGWKAPFITLSFFFFFWPALFPNPSSRVFFFSPLPSHLPVNTGMMTLSSSGR